MCLGSITNWCCTSCDALPSSKCKARQDQLKAEEMLSLDDLLTPPFATDTNWSAEEINNELENNCQGIF